MSTFEELQHALATAAEVLPEPSIPDYMLPAQLGKVTKRHPWSCLLKVIAATPELRCFDGKMQLLAGGSAMRVNYDYLAAWLLRRAWNVGTPQAIADLERYLSLEEVPVRLMVVVGGIKVSSTHTIPGGYRLEPVVYETMSDSVREFLTQRLFGSPMGFPGAILSRDATVRRLFADDIGLEQLSAAPNDQTEVQDLLLCLCLSVPRAPVAIAFWFESPAWAPMQMGGYAMPFVEGRPFPHNVDEAVIEEGARLFAIWQGLSPARQAELRVPLQRLSTAIRRTQQVDSAIDLGIALESIFLRDLDETTELTFRLRVRAARWLGTNAGDRERVQRLVGDLYKCRSRAAHRGTLPATIRGRPVGELLSDGYRLVAGALQRALREQDPDWDSVTFD